MSRQSARNRKSRLSRHPPVEVPAALLLTLLVVIAWASAPRPAVGARAAPDPSSRDAPAGTLFGFTPFPYDTTLEAVTKTRDTITPHSTLWALHYDNGIPWKEALADTPFPERVRRQWEGDARAIPKDHVVYVALAPLDTDRKSLAPATGDQERISMPEALRGAPLDDASVERAYLNYARRAVTTFHPRYLNLGIEAGEIMSRDFARWPPFERLYDYVRLALKREFPELRIGISFGLGELRAPKEAAAARALIMKCDYVGISFYPYASSFDEKFGAPPYRGEKPWREPLAWLRAYTSKPIAVCETGFSSQDIEVPQYGLKMRGSPQAQADYTKELFAISRRDRYAFVVWFLAIDYDRLYAKLPTGSDAMKLWRNIGFLDGDLRPKPAWEIWKAGVEASRQHPERE
jgi:hypothetical protein